MPNRSILFIDGNNWYHGMKSVQVPDLGALNYAKISTKLVSGRQWAGIRYYIGRVSQKDNATLYASQRKFVSSLLATDTRVSVHFGRLEQRPAVDRAAQELKRYLHGLSVKLPTEVYRELFRIAEDNTKSISYVEKAVDVMVAVDMVVMAERDEYDTAYLLSADGDFTPAVEAVRSVGKTVFAANPNQGGKLAGVVNSFIRLRPDWFTDCYY
jgi:uncharacterized LabA/DUF88 family protein